MHYYKIIKDGKITQVGSQSFPVTETEEIKPITQEEHDSIVTEWQEHAAKVQEYVDKVKSGEMTLDDVPEEYRAEVEEIMNRPEPPDPEQQEVDELLEEVSRIGY